ncbi:uncharacterized protein LOC132181936 [Corylus avellana]|uniref:uncharacterized protein LOC132181936 n=1 Tax=Corylus avellana TaxID=13451 RepID=UPI00286D2788|nr:uncharacterized protein LOC132181936 [Corylus avellana]
MEVISREVIHSLWGGQHVGWKYKGSNGLSGGMLMMWDRRVVECKEECVGLFTLACSFQNVEDRWVWAFGGVYGPNEEVERRALWDELAGLMRIWEVPWCLGGDFNIVRFPSERSNVSYYSSGMMDFSDFISENNLELDELAESRGLDQEEKIRKADKLKDLENTLLCEEIHWRQKSKALWLKEGDRNTRFFHKMANSHRRYNRVEVLRINGALSDDPVEVKEHIVQYYQSLYSEQSSWRPRMDNQQFLSIDEEDNSWLEREFEEKEIPELDFEIPPEAQRGSLSTVEGILVRAVDELQALQEERKKVNPQTAEAIDQFLLKLKACATGDSSFSFILDDPSGNSFIENPFSPSLDPSLIIKFYERTPEQQASLGYLADPSQSGDHCGGPSTEETSGASDEVRREPHGSVGATAAHRSIAQSNSADIVETVFRYSAPEEVMTFPSTCGTCASKCETRMFVTKIPYFQEVIVMASTCDACGYRNSELKPGGRIPEKGKRIALTVKNISDLSRDLIKSDTASVEVPELDLELASGTLGGVVTTVEGLITKISESLERVHGFTLGDSLDDCKRTKWQEFKARLNKLLSLEEPWTLILDDALANSFVAPVTEDIKDDDQMTFEEYERSWEQNEELGLNDIDTSSADAAYNSTDMKMGEKTDV